MGGSGCDGEGECIAGRVNWVRERVGGVGGCIGFMGDSEMVDENEGEWSGGEGVDRVGGGEGEWGGGGVLCAVQCAGMSRNSVSTNEYPDQSAACSVRNERFFTTGRVGGSIPRRKYFHYN